MQVSDFQPPMTQVSLAAPIGLMWNLSGAAATVHGDWKYRSAFLKDKGSFDATASGITVTVSVFVGAGRDGRPVIKTIGCSGQVDELHIRLQGDLGPLYNMLAEHVENSLKPKVHLGICRLARYAIDVVAARSLKLPVKVALNAEKTWELYYGLDSAPTAAPGYLEFHHDVVLFEGSVPVEVPFQPSPPLPSPPATDHMMTVWVSDHMLNTISYGLFRGQNMNYSLTADSLPQHQRSLLSTSCGPLPRCIGAFVPAIGNAYPHAFVEVGLSLSAAPKVAVKPQQLTATCFGTVRLQARLSNGSLAHLFDVEVGLKIKAAARMEGVVLKAKVISAKKKLDVTYSSVGPVSTAVVRLIYDVAVKKFLIPALNDVGEKGLPLLTATEHDGFENTDIRLESGYAKVSADVAGLKFVQ